MTAVRRKQLLLHKGRRGGDSEPFSMLPVEMMKSDAYRTLPHPARSVLAVLAAQYNGLNNGSLSLTKRTAAEYGIGNAHVLYDALSELQERGLVTRTRPGSRKPPLSAFYALGWRIIDPSNARDPHDANATLTPTNGWKTWSDGNQRHHWTIKRRIQRWPVVTLAGGAWSPEKPKMGGAWPPNEGNSRVARGPRSNISGVGGA